MTQRQGNKLAEAQVIEIRTRYRHGNGVQLAAAYGVSSALISQIVRGKKWPHVPGEIRPSSRTTRPGEARAWLDAFIDAFNGGDVTDDCVLWPFGDDGRGYAQIGNGRTKHTTRVIIERLLERPLTTTEYACHTCDVPRCINPCHLFIGTNEENIADMMRKGRQARGSGNPAARLTEAAVRMIRSVGGRANVAHLAERFGVSVSHMRRIISGRYWKAA